MAERVEFTVPLPPACLRSNSRAFWATKKKAADAYSEQTYWMYVDGAKVSSALEQAVRPFRWRKAHVTYTWRHAGVAPDHSNLGGNTKYLQDCLQMAPKNGAGKDRWYLGLVENDSGITAEYRLEKVAHRKDEGVLVTVERL